MDAALKTVLDLSLLRAHVVREVDADLGSFHGLGLGDLALLLELRAAPEGRARRVDLARALGISPSGVARQLAPLERIGMVERRSHERDARLALVALTEAGRRVADEAVPTAEHAAVRALERLWTPAERERLARMLDRARARY